MIAKAWLFIKKALIFVGVAGGSFLILFIVLGFCGLFEVEGIISDIALLATLILPFVCGAMAIRKKRTGVPSAPVVEKPTKTLEKSFAEEAAKAEEQIPPRAVPAPAVPVDKAPAQTRKVNKYKVAGVTHYVDNIMELATEDPDYNMSKRELIEEDRVRERVWKYFFAPQNVELVPEDDNPQDPKAIKVVIDGQHVGYIKSGSCAHLRKVMGQGCIEDIDCMIGGGPYKYISLEYDDEKDKEVYTLEKDSTTLFVHLNITERS